MLISEENFILHAYLLLLHSHEYIQSLHTIPATSLSPLVIGAGMGLAMRPQFY